MIQKEALHVNMLVEIHIRWKFWLTAEISLRWFVESYLLSSYECHIWNGTYFSRRITSWLDNLNFCISCNFPFYFKLFIWDTNFKMRIKREKLNSKVTFAFEISKSGEQWESKRTPVDFWSNNTFFEKKRKISIYRCFLLFFCIVLCSLNGFVITRGIIASTGGTCSNPSLIF